MENFNVKRMQNIAPSDINFIIYDSVMLMLPQAKNIHGLFLSRGN